MTTEHWRLVWDLCEQARQLPREEQQDYVRAHAPDQSMAREALSLLAEPEASVLPSWDTSSNSDAPGTPRAADELVGAHIGHYTIGKLIGRGASGEVYSAICSELERRVAIKFLRYSDNESGWRAESFLREARAASALNHPGIVTVHEVMQSEAGLAIVMELVEGRSLRELCGTPNSIEDVARWGSQVTKALAAAHGSRIIHRDIKPENIVLRPDGLAKLLDFGLAQRGGLADGRKSQLVGTLRYMSPEQAAGKELTPASDVFSFGLVLYELIAGRPPFPASGLEAILRAISECRPEPISRWRRDVPKPLEALILEMLRKAPEARPSAAEVARRLEPFAHPVTRRKGFLWAGLATAALAIATVWTVRQREPAAIAPLAAVPLTTTAGFDSWPDISPDGKSVVYGWGASADAFTHLYMKELDQDTPVKLIDGEPGVRVGHPRWSSDGQRIFYKRTVPNWAGDAIWSVARDGTDRRPVTSLNSAELSSGIDLSADGARILFGDQASQNQWPYRLYSLDLRSGQKTQLTAPQQGWGDWDPRYSPDGKQIAFKRVQRPGDDQIYLMPATGGQPQRLTMPRQSVYGHVWTPEGRLLFAAQFRSVIHGLWMISPAGNSQPSPIFESGFDSTMPAANRERIVWVNLVNDQNIYSVPLAGGAPVKRIASPLLDSMPTLSSDGRLAFVSRRSGSPEIWISRQDGGGAARVTNLKGDLTRPHWSPDGARIAFSMTRRGVSKVYVMRCAAGTLTCETPEALVEGSRPTWTADGKSVYFEGVGTGEIRKMPLSGGQAVTVIQGLEAIVSRDGQWLYFSRMSNANGSFLRIGIDKDGNTLGTEEPVLELIANSAEFRHWTLAGDEILFWESNVESRFSGLRAYNVKTKRLRTIVETPQAAYPAVSPDGKTVWYAQPDSAGATLMTAERR